jgi:hypothetical protein
MRRKWLFEYEATDILMIVRDVVAAERSSFEPHHLGGRRHTARVSDGSL